MPKVKTDAAMTSEMISILRETMEKSHAAGDTRRGAHAKSHGLLKAQFVVHDGIPSELKVGIFREPKNYAALIRLSNASASVKSDKQKDFRGFAIKLLGVEGDRVNQDEKQSQNQTASFGFFVQFFDREATTPIEDAAVEWPTARSPFIKLATIQIPIQRIDNAVRQEWVETMAFSPAHALAVHHPLGGLNTARSEIYKVLSQFRHQRNGKIAMEPTHELFNSLE